MNSLDEPFERLPISRILILAKPNVTPGYALAKQQPHDLFGMCPRATETCTALDLLLSLTNGVAGRRLADSWAVQQDFEGH